MNIVDEAVSIVIYELAFNCPGHVDHGKSYVGQTVLTTRKSPNRTPLDAIRARKLSHEASNRTAFDRFIREHGEEKFDTRLLEIVSGIERANAAEKAWIERLNTLRPLGFNRRVGGQTVLTPKDWSNIATIREAAVTPAERAARSGRVLSQKERQHRSESARAWQSRKTPEERREAIRKALETLGPEGRSERARKRAQQMGPERLSAAIRKGYETRGPDGRLAAILKRKQNMDFASAAKKASETLGPEGRSLRARNRIANMNAEQLQEIVLRGHVVKRIRRIERALLDHDLSEVRRLLATGFVVAVRWPLSVH